MKLTEERLIEIIKEEMEANSAPTIAQTTDYIISTLESLFDSLTEDLNEIEIIEEKAGSIPDKALQWIWWGPRAKKAQAKVNKIKLNIAAIEFAADSADNPDAKKKLQTKAKQSKEQSSSLQTMVNDKYGAKGEITKKYLASEKIKGQLEVIKKTTGMTDDPNKSSALKDQMKSLNKKLKSEDDALKSLEPGAEEIETATAEIKKKKKEAGQSDDTPDADKAAADKAAADKADADKPAAGVTKTDTETDTDTEAETETDTETETDDGADAKLKAAKDALAKAKEGDDEEAIKKAQSAVDALGAKESKSTKDYNVIMNETKNHSQSVRDRFSRLL